MTMQNKVVLITGATNGIGEVAARDLAGKGATVIVVGRNETKARKTVSDIQSETGNKNVHYMLADLSVMQQVRDLATQFSAQYDRLDVLLNNAGAYFNERHESADGNEMTLALNHLNYFLLTHLLLDTLKATAAQHGEARVVNVSSGAHRVGGLTFDDLQRRQKFGGFRAYGESKLMNIMFTYALARRLEGTNVTSNALHPGLVRTGFGKNNGGLLNTIFSALQVFGLSAEEGAQTSIYLASSPEVKGVSGKYFEKKKAVNSSQSSYDEAAQERLWQISEELTGIAQPEPA